MGNPFTYVQLQTRDLARAKSFYGQLFEWHFDTAPEDKGEYTEVDVGAGTAGGMMTAPPGAPSQWIPYVAVEDIANSTEKAESLGAKVLAPPFEVPGKGSYSVIADPTGAVFALWQVKPA